MKKTYLSLTLIALLTACGTTTTGPNPFISAAAGIAGLASEWAVNQYPDKRAQFTAAEGALRVWLETGKANGTPLNLAELNSILSNLNLGQEGWGANGELYLQGGLIIWNLMAGLNYQVTSQPAIAAIGESIRAGFARGLAKPVSAPAQRTAPALQIPRLRPGRLTPI